MKYVTSKQAREQLQISAMTLKNWKDKGIIEYKKLSDKKYLYDVDSIYSEQKQENTRKINVIYARVSNTKQKDDLDRQIRLIKEFMVSSGVKPDEVISDVASGMNQKRPGFTKLISMIMEKKVEKIYISYKDRLIRFNFDLIQDLCLMHGSEIEVINLTTEEDFQQELTEDFVSILHHFSMKMYSNRRKQLKQLEKDLKNQYVND